jgi:hypothetical protein
MPKGSDHSALMVLMHEAMEVLNAAIFRYSRLLLNGVSSQCGAWTRLHVSNHCSIGIV